MPIITETFPSTPHRKYEILQVDGRRFPTPFDESIIHNIPQLKLRDDDILLCGYMRAGTHWVFEILNMLLSGQVETFPDRKESLHLEQASQEKLDTFPSPRVLSSHLLFEELPREVTDRKTKVIYLVRDPRDSLASWYTCITKIWRANVPDWFMSFPDWLELSNNGKLEWGSWFENIQSWERALQEHPDHPVHLLYYEELLQDTVDQIMTMASFFGVERDIDFCKRIAEKTQFKTMVQDKEKYTERFGGVAVHYNKGIVGNWKTLFTVGMSEQFDKLYESKMAGSRFRDRYSHSGM